MDAGDRIVWLLEDENPVIDILPGDPVTAGVCAYMWDALSGEGRVLISPEAERQLDALPAVGVPFTRSFEVQILDNFGLQNPGHHDCGGIVRVVGPNKNMVKPAGEWNRYTITMKGRRYKQYRGMGSLGVMSSGQSSDRYFQKKEIGSTKFVPEGVEGVTPYVGHVGEITIEHVTAKSVGAGFTPEVMVWPSAYGISLRLRTAGVRRPATEPASDTRYRLNCRGIGAQ